jgi:MoxR-like ATPase
VERQSKAEFEAIVHGAGTDPTAAVALEPITALTVPILKAHIEDQGLKFDDESLAGRIHAALGTGKHLLLQGPPGTGKTELAIAIAKAAQSVAVCHGYAQIAGSSDWTPADTIGTYRLNRDKDLEFAPGLVLGAVDQRKWVVLDELNRAAIDQAMGPLFTVLSGQSVVLRFEEEDATGDFLTVAIVPENELLGARYRHYEIPATWRIIATMNTLDVDLLFEISQAFLRRFAIVEVSGPSAETHEGLLSAYATGVADVDNMVLRLPHLPKAPLGPAITIDCAKYVRERVASGEQDPKRLADEILESFIRPQLSHLNALEREAVRVTLLGAPAGAAAVAEDEE